MPHPLQAVDNSVRPHIRPKGPSGVPTHSQSETLCFRCGAWFVAPQTQIVVSRTGPQCTPERPSTPVMTVMITAPVIDAIALAHRLRVFSMNSWAVCGFVKGN